MEKISMEVTAKRSAALVMITKGENGPGKEGFILGVFEDGSTLGTIGGGAVEFNAIAKAKECIKQGKNMNFIYDLGPNGNIGSLCGGITEIYIKTFKAPEKMLIIGGGHIALELYKLSEMMQFKSIIFDDREEYANNNRFPNSEIILGEYKENLIKYSIDEHCYVVIVTKGHRFDEASLEAVANSKAAYIGMIGSANKTSTIMSNLIAKGISQDKLKRVYAPTGLNLGGDTPCEIAISIMSEILLVKNNGKLTHMKI